MLSLFRSLVDRLRRGPRPFHAREATSLRQFFERISQDLPPDEQPEYFETIRSLSDEELLSKGALEFAKLMLTDPRFYEPMIEAGYEPELTRLWEADTAEEAGARTFEFLVAIGRRGLPKKKQ
ncbi:MAG: hypothetical protein WCE23_01965 [Candidatus Binatus sp.]|uniref:hypothetical protein n=1 Tax=Candidatus Binatus sp. TaxID=2811406 RepID=UPI003C713EF4